MKNMKQIDRFKPEVALKDIAAIALTLQAESERGCVLVATSLIEEMLKDLLKAHFRRDASDSDELFQGYKPLGTFHSRIEIAYQLELINDTQRSALNILRKIRNDYAHLHLPVEFDSDRMKEFCKREIGPTIDLSIMWESLDQAESPRAKFIDCVVSHCAIFAANIEASANRRVDQIRILKFERERDRHIAEVLEKELEKHDRFQHKAKVLKKKLEEMRSLRRT